MKKGIFCRSISIIVSMIMVLLTCFQYNAGQVIKVQAAESNYIDLADGTYEIYIKSSDRSVEYTGEDIEPTVIVKKKSDVNALNPVDSSNYDTTYLNNKKVGTATITVTGKNENGYEGTLTQQFEITKKAITTRYIYIDGKATANRLSNTSTATKTYTYTAGGVEPKVYIKNSETNNYLVEGEDYDLTIVNNGIEHARLEDEGGEGPQVWIEGLKNSNYYFDNINNTIVFYFGIKAAELSNQNIVLSGDSFKYTGKEIRPEVTIYDAQTNAKLSSDNGYEYKVEYKDNTQPGTATVIITGTEGRYNGTVEKTFKIISDQENLKDIQDAEIVVEDQTYDGKEKRPVPVVTYQGNVLTEGKDYIVSNYTNNVNATDSAMLTISGQGDYCGVKSGSFVIKSRDINNTTYTTSEVTYSMANNKAIKVFPKVTVNDSAIGVSLSSGSSDKADDYVIDNSQYVKGEDYNAGEHVFYLVGKGNYSGTKECVFNIQPAEISAAKITANDAAYSGEALTTTIESVIYNNSQLVEGKDYKISGYSNNVEIGTNTAIVTIEGINNFKGQATARFSILKNEDKIDIATLSCEEIEDQVYTGENITPDVRILDSENKLLIKDTDYTLKYESNLNAGEAKTTIIGIGKYTGVKEVGFNIIPYNITDNITCLYEKNYVYNGNLITPEINVQAVMNSGHNYTLIKDKDYSVSYENNKNVLTLNSKPTINITGLGNFSGTYVCYFDITSKNIEKCKVDEIEDQTWTGIEIKPLISVYDGDTKLVENTDYVVKYNNNIEVGTATVQIDGNGNYKGSVQKNFNIKAIDIHDAVIGGVPDEIEYTGKNITLTNITVSLNGENLKEGIDYEVDYVNNLNVTSDGEYARVTVTGKGKYSGNISKEFRIVKRDIQHCTVDSVEAQIYTGEEIVPTIIVRDGNTILTGDKDYTVYCTDNINCTNSAKIKVEGKGNYTGSIEKEFSITKKDISDADCYIEEIPGQIYTGEEIKPVVVISYGANSLVKDIDYEIAYYNNINPTSSASPAVAIITGKGNYEGKVEKEFTITKNPIDISAAVVATISDQEFSREYKTPTPVVTYMGNVLKKDVDYRVSYVDNYNVGTAILSITGCGDYVGSIRTSFKITKRDISGYKLLIADNNIEYNGNLITPVLISIVNETGDYTIDGDELDEFSITYSSNLNAGTAKINVLAGNDGNYAGAIVGSFEICARSINKCSITCDVPADCIEGQNKPTVIVKDGEKKLTEDSDYILSYEFDTDGIKVIITGKMNYTDSVTKHYAITSKSINDAEVLGIIDKTFTGNEIIQDIKVIVDGVQLEQETDYTVKYKDNVHAGTATITITGIRNYKDSIEKSFSIKRRDISENVTISGVSDEVEYDGEPYQFNALKVTLDGKDLNVDEDYIVTYQNNDEITILEKASITITFIGDYSGSIVKQFTINGIDISKATVSAIADKTYTGSAIKPAVTVKIGSTVINPKEYTVEYSNNVKPGVAGVTITGLNNFYGTKKVTFNILPAKVKNLAASGETTTSLKLSWSSSAYAQGYEVYRYDTGKKTYVKVATVTGTSSNITGLAAGTDYKFAVSAYVKSSGKTLYSEKTVISAATKPAKVSGISFSSRAEKSIALKWNTVKGATGYKVYRLVSKDNYKYLGSTSKPAYNANGLTGSTAYTFKVVAYKKVGSKELVGEDATARIMTTPSAVKNLKISARSNASITMKWSKVNNADGYIVYRYSGNRAVKIKTITSKSKVVFVSSKLSAGTTYKYRVVAYKKDGKAIVENAGTYVSGFTLPATPVVSAKAGVKQAKIAWKRAKGATGYIVYMSTSKRGTYKAVATIRKAGTTSYTKKGLKKGKTYYFKVRAFNKSGKTTYKSSYSTVKKIVVK